MRTCTLQNVLPRSTDRWRHVVYACYQPRALATEQDLDVKRTAWRDFRVTTHWPAQQVSLFPEGGTGEETTLHELEWPLIVLAVVITSRYKTLHQGGNASDSPYQCICASLTGRSLAGTLADGL